MNPTSARSRRHHGFTLVEMLVVMGIVLMLMVLLAPAFTKLKSAGDVTSAAYTIKGMLDQARTYAMSNNTYTYVGFAGSIGTTAASVTGQVMLAAFVSTDGTQSGLSSGNYRQFGKLMKLDNTHIGDTGVPTPDGTEFESRATVDPSHRISSAGAGAYTITAQQTTFKRWIQFSPRGEAVVNGNASITQYAEVGIQPTHGTALAVSQDANGKWIGNIVAVQISGFSGNVRIYRR